ncbi:MAG: alanine--tRNA ligase, partial [Candidatus Omnitrophica bacterium]|nr:alanine--tRNA ligase [Candidatus Omnitrophota bacterium]
FFEMLGNFSFGDYFKEEAIEFAWEFITKELKMDDKNLWVSVYKDDDEAYDIWKDKIGVSEEKIVRLGEESNFWPASAPSDGPNGPCGSCSEIFFDNGVNIDCENEECNPDCSCGRFVEVWNLVFTQFNRVGVNKLEPLPQKNIDTGMGLERMAAVLQKKESNFEIDILAPVVDEVKKMIVKSSHREKLIKSSVNAIVDHARAATFSIADGVYPSNEGRGYVIRKIIRRALLKARGLGNRQPFLFKLPKRFAELMGDIYPEIKQKKDNISKIIAAEEEKYFLMIKEGEAQVNLLKDLTPEDVFRLYDTYGLPLEIIKEFAQVKGFSVDEEKFEALLKEQQERSRKKSMFDSSIFKEGGFDLKEKSEFIGYDNLEVKCKILKLFVDNTEKELINKDQEGLVILDKTPFYAEGGGQSNDKGRIVTKSGELKVDKVFKVADAIIHQGSVVNGEIKKEEAVAFVDQKRREALARAHTATHLLQTALRCILGEHVVQQGSLVDEDKFRFDFTHFNRLTDKNIEAVENLVIKFIANADQVCKKELSLEDAKKEGALAFFKDKYHNSVRMVSISDYSKELCGGTHVNNTSQIEKFAIISESSISSGVRRIEASVNRENGNSLLTRRRDKEEAKKVLEEKKKADKINIIKAIDNQEAEFISSETGDIIGLEKIEEINLLVRVFKPKPDLKDAASKAILAFVDRIKQKIGSGIIFIATKDCDKDTFICSATDDIIKKGFSCKKFISEFGESLFLTGGGNDKKVQGVVGERKDDFVVRVKEAINKFIKK